MRTTLTIDEDVAVQLERIRLGRDASLRDIVNEALRLGLQEMHAPKEPRKPFRTRTFRMGKPLVNIDDVTEALAHAEGENFK